MANSNSFVKDPDEVMDYTFDWETWLDSDTISSSSMTVGTGLTDDEADTNDTTSATVWVSGGTAGTCYEVKNTIVTAAGRTAERTIYIDVKEL